jgi:hypothetical protein
MPELSKVALQVDSNQSFPNNNNGYITPAILRSYNTNVIDSTVNQIQYTTDSGSWNQTLQSINAKTGSYATTGSNTFIGNQSITGSVTASFFKGDGSALTNVVVGENINLNNFTASQDIKNSTLATYTGSVDTKFTTIGSDSGSWINTALNTYTQSQDTKNSTLSTYTASVDTKFSTIGSASGSWINTSLNSYTQSQDTKNSTLATYTGSVDTKFTTIGTYTASQDTKNTTLATYTGSNDTKWSTLSNVTASILSATASLNSFTSSQETKNTTLATYTGSIDTKFTTLGTYTASVDTKFSTLATYTGSVDTKFTTLSQSTASLNTYTASLITAFTASGTTITVNGTTTLKSNLFVTGGVFQNIVSQSIVASTASLDFSQGTYFTLTLADNTTTHIKPTTLSAGVSATLVITTGTNSSASLAPTMLQPSGFSYSATPTSGKIDLLSLVSTNTSNVFVVATKNMV